MDGGEGRCNRRQEEEEEEEEEMVLASEPKGQKQQPLPDVMVISKLMQK